MDDIQLIANAWLLFGVVLDCNAFGCSVNYAYDSYDYDKSFILILCLEDSDKLFLFGKVGRRCSLWNGQFSGRFQIQKSLFSLLEIDSTVG